MSNKESSVCSVDPNYAYFGNDQSTIQTIQQL